MKKRVLIAEIKHETNTFCSTITDEKAFAGRYLKHGEEIPAFFKGVKVEMGGILKACEEEGLEIIPSIAANATPGGKVSRVFFEKAKGRILDDIGKNPVIDGIILSLHGAMVLDDDEDGEGELLEALRNAVGDSVPIMASLDLHANVTKKMAYNCDAFFAYETYPHEDTYDRAYQAAKTMARTLRGELKPVVELRRIPILAPYLETSKDPMKAIMDMALEGEKAPGVIKISILHGFSWADISEAGMSVVVTADKNRDLASSIADEFAKMLWERRKTFVKHATPLDDAVEKAINSTEHPVLLADIADNPGGGGPGDGTFILRSLLEKGAENTAIALITDPESVNDAIRAGVGGKFQVRLGGKAEKLHGEPVIGEAYVKTLCDGIFVNKGPMAKGLTVNVGKMAVLKMGGVDIIVCERRHQPWDPEIFRRVGIQPEDRNIVVVKSSMHYRAAYTDLVRSIIEVDTPGLTTTNFSHFPYENLTRPIFPLDPDTGFPN